MADISIAIIGAGIIGFQVGRELLSNGFDNFAIFEANQFCGEHSSSRNSGVLHAGIYYPEGSLKQRLCVEGNRLWTDISNDLGIPLIRPGKFIISTNSKEDSILEDILELTKKKNVPGIRRMSKLEIDEVSPYVNISNGFLSETTGILNVSEALKKFENFFFQKNIPVLKGQKVERIEREGKEFILLVNNEKIRAEVVINCAGLNGIQVREQLGLRELEDYWVKGRYLKLKKEFYTNKLIYPVPQKNLKGLGVHTSFDFDKMVRFGPDTEEVDKVDYSLKESVIDEVYPAINKIFKGIEKSELMVDYSGIRSKIKLRETGKQHIDFWIKNPISNYFEVLGTESPGLTSSPSIAKYVVSLIR